MNVLIVVGQFDIIPDKFHGKVIDITEGTETHYINGTLTNKKYINIIHAEESLRS
jgi:hypothetical protein